MEQFDQLLTCCVCLDRYRNPKLLPCQHSFCMEPCMEGLVDYVKRQVKCPECRAEHRIPYQGVQAFPTNVTLTRFLELHIDLTGELPDPTRNQIMERCQVCSEKEYLNLCAHCDKKICPDCKEAHIDVLKREITRLSSQVRRVLHRLEDALSITDKNLVGLKGNQAHVIDEVDDLVRRFTKAIRDKGDALRNELESYVTTELTTLNSHRTSLETEIANIQSNCDLVDKHMVAEGAGVTWDDSELMDTKDVFLKTVEFIRNFEHEPGDRRIRFSVNQDPNTIIIGLSNFGDLITPNQFIIAQNLLAPIQQAPAQSNSGLMRSKSDHRLVQQYRDMDDLDDKPSARSKYSKYGSSNNDDGDRKFRSRFTRRLLADDDENRVRFSDTEDRPTPVPARLRVIEADEAVKGPLSGVLRLLDSTRVLEKMVDFESPKKKLTVSTSGVPGIPLAIQQQMQLMHQQQLLQQSHQTSNPPTPTATPSTPWRQLSQESSSTPAPKATPTPVARKASTDKPRSESESSSSDHQTGSTSSATSSSHRAAAAAAAYAKEEAKRYTPSRPAQTPKSASPATTSKSSFRRNVTPLASSLKKDESESSSDESEETESEEPTSPAANTAKMERPDIGGILARNALARDRDVPVSTRSRVSARDDVPSRHRDTESSYSPRTRIHEEPVSSRTREPVLERRMSRDDGPGPAYTAYRSRQPKSPPERHYGSSSGATGSGSSAASRYGTSSTSSPYDYGGLSRSRTGTSLYEPPETPTSRLQSKYLNRSRHNLGSSMDADDHIRPSEDGATEQWNSSGRDKPRDKSKIISRSKSSHELAQPELEGKPEDEQSSLSSWARYLKSKYGKTAANNASNSQESSSENRTPDVPVRRNSASPQKLSLATSQYSAKKRLVFKFGSRGSDPGYFTWPRGVACSPDGNIVVADSSNHRIQVFDPEGTFIKDFGSYGNGDGEFDCLAGVAVNRIGQFIVSDRYNHRIQVFDPSGRFLRSFGSQGSTDGKFNYPWGVTTDALGFIYVCDKENHRVQVFQSDGTFVGKFGVGELEHPHYIGITSTNKVVVSDTGHHRVYIFDVNGKIIGAIGTEGTENGQFKLPRGVAVDEQGYIFVGDSGNNRIQIFSPDGHHIRSFGCWGCGDGEFKGLEGVAVNSQGNILVCDRENHRIQVF